MKSHILAIVTAGALLQPGARLDRRFRVNEITFYETQIAEVLDQTRAAGQRFQIQAGEQRLALMVEMSEALFANAVSYAEDPKRAIESELLARLGLEADVRFVEPQPQG